MKVIVVGLGIQGRKRKEVAGSDVVATIDPVMAGADAQRLEDVPLSTYDAALVCTPDGPKVELLTYLLSHGKHVLVEKPLVAAEDSALEQLKSLGDQHGAVCYTAYNHRFEPHLISVKKLLEQQRIGRVYRCRMFYGNGTCLLYTSPSPRD